jgi:hypothetical protein
MAAEERQELTLAGFQEPDGQHLFCARLDRPVYDMG